MGHGLGLELHNETGTQCIPGPSCLSHKLRVRFWVRVWSKGYTMRLGHSETGTHKVDPVCAAYQPTSAFKAPIPHHSIRHRRLTDVTNFHVTIGQSVVSDRNPACAILIRHKTLSDGEVKVCLFP